ncbi:hypothetical protein ACH5RR_032416 [Cinchona calisaya]|uniref:Chloride channel protein n=1 Tax=Cinchona calisaya TaxID=153742 RepID=A0ABD2YKL0_9GENT
MGCPAAPHSIECFCCFDVFFLRPRLGIPNPPPPTLRYSYSIINSSNISNRKSPVVCHNFKESSLMMTQSHTTTISPKTLKSRRRRRRSLLVPCNGRNNNEDENDSELQHHPPREVVLSSTAAPVVAEEDEDDVISPENKAIINACLVGLFTGIGVVLFNMAVHEIRDIFWDGIPDRGASWLREEPVEVKWRQVMLVPACGGLLVSMLNLLQTSLKESKNWILSSTVKATLEPIFKAVAACVTLGTGNSLGPEGPSVEIGTSIAKGVGTLFDNGSQRKLSLKAAGSAAGISSGFNAAVAGCFFAIESVLWPSPAESSSSLTNTTSMVILSSVIASLVTEIGLGSEPTFIVPNYDFRSPSELPLYLLLGILCGLVSVTLSRCTTFMRVSIDTIEKVTGVPNTIFPIFGGLTVGLIALAYPEILYWGFENVDLLLESRPVVEGLSANLLLQLVAVKILATSLCRASGLVGGYYAPSLFIGAATGMAYGKVVSFVISQSNPSIHLPFLEVAAPQAYGLVGMAATLAGVCQVPLTAVLLLFELTQDYRIVLPLLGAVGLSSWITSGQTRKKGVVGRNKVNNGDSCLSQEPEISSSSTSLISSTHSGTEETSDESDLGENGRLLYLDVCNDTNDIAERILVAQAMRTRYATVQMSTSITEAISLMLAEKQSCAVIVDDKDFLIGLLTLANIQHFNELSKAKARNPKELIVSDVCPPEGEECQMALSVTPNMTLLSAQTLMYRHGTSQVPVVQDHGHPVGLLDNECISLTCRGLAIGERLQRFSTLERLKNASVFNQT